MGNSPFLCIKRWDCCHYASSQSSSIPFNIVFRQFFKSQQHSKLSQEIPALFWSVAEHPFLQLLSLPSQYPLYINVSIVPISVWFSCTVVFSLKSTAMTTIGISAWLSGRAPVNWPLMMSVLEVMRNHRFLSVQSTIFEFQGVSGVTASCWYSSSLQNCSWSSQWSWTSRARRKQLAQQVKTSMFHKCDHLLLWDLGTKPVCHISTRSVAVQSIGLKDKWIVIKILQLLRGNQFLSGYLRREKYLQRVVQTSQSCMSSFDVFEGRSILEIPLLINGLSFVEFPVQQKSVRALIYAAAKPGATIGILNQMTVKAFNELRSVTRLPSLSGGIALYTIFDQKLVSHTEFSSCVDGPDPITQSRSFEDFTCHLSTPHGVDLESYSRTSGQESAFRHITYSLFEMLHQEVGNNALYQLGTNWSDLNKVQRP